MLIFMLFDDIMYQIKMRGIIMKVIKHFPGMILSFIIAVLAMRLESLLPIHLIGSAVIAMFIGMIINRLLVKTDIFASGIKFTSKKLLKFAIILLGLSLNITTVLQVGKMSLTVMAFTLLTCFGGGYFIGRALKLNWKLSNLISAGTGICGGSAIAASHLRLKPMTMMLLMPCPQPSFLIWR